MRKVKAMLDRRRFSYRNQKRMDRLLVLIALHLNEQDSEAVYSQLIRQHLMSNHDAQRWTVVESQHRGVSGRPALARHDVYDRREQPSLVRR